MKEFTNDTSYRYMNIIWTHIDKFIENAIKDLEMSPEDEDWNEKFKTKFVGCLSDRSKIFNKFPIKLEQEFIFFNSE